MSQTRLHTWNWAVRAQRWVRWTPQPGTLQHTPAESCATPWGPEEGAPGQYAAGSLGAGHGGWGEKELPLKTAQMRAGPASPGPSHSPMSVLCSCRLCHQTGRWGSVIRAGALAGEDYTSACRCPCPRGGPCRPSPCTSSSTWDWVVPAALVAVQRYCPASASSTWAILTMPPLCTMPGRRCPPTLLHVT